MTSLPTPLRFAVSFVWELRAVRLPADRVTDDEEERLPVLLFFADAVFFAAAVLLLPELLLAAERCAVRDAAEEVLR